MYGNHVWFQNFRSRLFTEKGHSVHYSSYYLFIHSHSFNKSLIRVYCAPGTSPKDKNPSSYGAPNLSGRQIPSREKCTHSKNYAKATLRVRDNLDVVGGKVFLKEAAYLKDKAARMGKSWKRTKKNWREQSLQIVMGKKWEKCFRSTFYDKRMMKTVVMVSVEEGGSWLEKLLGRSTPGLCRSWKKNYLRKICKEQGAGGRVEEAR